MIINLSLKMRMRHIALLCMACILSACALSIENAPINLPQQKATLASVKPPQDIAGENLIALAFSGGGVRAAAFSFGVLQALQAAGAKQEDVLDDVTFISSVSGGSLTAAYYGLHGKAAMQSFRSKVLMQDMERGMRLSAFTPEGFIRLLRGGLNDRRNLAQMLDKEVFEGATFADLYKRRKPDIWINATDLYNRTPFPFIPPLFAGLCSDLPSFSVAEAVSASMAVPLVFAPVVLKTYPDQCLDPIPDWVARSLADPAASKVMNASANAVRNYRDAKRMRYIKLVDGGVTDNFGLASLLIARSVSRTPYGPFSARDAVHLRRMIFLVVDAGRAPTGLWALDAFGPPGLDLALSATDTAIDALSRFGFDAFRQMLGDWQNSVTEFRCGLSDKEVLRLRGSLKDWKCDDLNFEIGLVSFADLEPVRAARLAEIPTRLTLPQQDIDDAIQAGADAVQKNPAFLRYLKNRIHINPQALKSVQ